jgi:hypothetical protein
MHTDADRRSRRHFVLASGAARTTAAVSPAVLEPWEVLKTEEKVARLRRLLQRELAREIPLLTAA